MKKITAESGSLALTASYKYYVFGLHVARKTIGLCSLRHIESRISGRSIFCIIMSGFKHGLLLLL